MSFNIQEDVKFIEEELLPKMVHDRCFCEEGSREFVEFYSADIDNNPREVKVPFHGLVYCAYSANVTINFSDIPVTFPIIIKLVPKPIEQSPSFGNFLMEEYFYTKMIKKYNKELFPKCYLSNLGKYGRPVIVVENLLKTGYQNSEQNLTPEELKLCLKYLGQFHAYGLKLKKEDPMIYREFKTNIYTSHLSETDKELCNQLLLKAIDELQPDSYKVEEKLTISNNPYDSLQMYNIGQDGLLHTPCHGNLQGSNLFFKYENNEVIGVKFDNFEFMKISSVGLHFNTFMILNKKLPQIKLQELEDYIESYLNGLKEIYSEITKKDLEKDIKETLMFSFVNVSLLNL